MQRRTKQKIVIALAAAAGTAMIVYALYFFNRSFGYRTYADKKAGFSIQYPHHWAYAVNKDGANVIFYTPFESELDMFTENANVVVVDISKKPMSLIEFTNLALKQVEALFASQIKIVESEPYPLGNTNGYKYTIEGVGESSLKFMMVWTLKGTDVYQFTYAALDSDYDRYLADIEKMVKSFRILR
jgi:hypothetical protein